MIVLRALFTWPDEMVSGGEGGAVGGPGVCVPPLCAVAGGLKAGVEDI